MIITSRSYRHAVLIAVASMVVALPTGCTAPPPVPPVTFQAVVLDVSGSTTTSGAVQGYGDRAGRLIDGSADGTTIVVLVADGASQGSTCIPLSVRLLGDGPNPVQAADDLAADRVDAAAALHAQIACGQQKSTPGSDLVGALLAADRLVPGGATRRDVAVYSDGMQASRDAKLTRSVLTDPQGPAALVATLQAAGLVPTHLSGGVLTITDPGVGVALTARQAQGLLAFWSAYATAAGMTLDGGAR